MSTPLLCPRCDVALFRGDAVDGALFGCGTCGGVWVDNAVCQRIYEKLPADALELAGKASRQSQVDVCTALPIACPACRVPLRRIGLQAAGVQVDTCAEHGTWFDRDELMTVAMAFGADRAREQEREQPTYVTPVVSPMSEQGESRGGEVLGAIAGGVLEDSFNVVLSVLFD